MLTKPFNSKGDHKKRKTELVRGELFLSLNFFVQSSNLQEKLSQYTVTEKGNNLINESPA